MISLPQVMNAMIHRLACGRTASWSHTYIAMHVILNHHRHSLSLYFSLSYIPRAKYSRHNNPGFRFNTATPPGFTPTRRNAHVH